MTASKYASNAINRRVVFLIFLEISQEYSQILDFHALKEIKRITNGKEMWARQGSNLRPIGYEPTALPLSYEPVYCRGINPLLESIS